MNGKRYTLSKSTEYHRSMEFPFGRQHHHRDGEEEDACPPPRAQSFVEPPPPPPPSYYREDEAAQSLIHVYHSSHVEGFGLPTPYPPPPAEFFNFAAFSQQEDCVGYPPPPPPSHVSITSGQHVSHDEGDPPLDSEMQRHHNYIPHLPSFLHHHTRAHCAASDLSNKPSVRVFCKAETGYSLTIRDGKVILALSDQSDGLQHWIKDEKYSTRVKDEEGFPSFALVNKATGQAMKHSVGATHPVQLIPYNTDVLDESILWTESRDLGDGFRTIRMVNNIRLNVDAFHGDKNHGGIHDGTVIVLWEWKKGDNQRWKIIPC